MRNSPIHFKLKIRTVAFFALAVFPLCTVHGSGNRPVDKAKGVTVSYSDFHGWNAIVLRNCAAEVVIVPEIGRIMEFNSIDDKGRTMPGPFWKNPALAHDMPADVEGWRNFGGDKAWPAPQSDWPRVSGRAWPPPIGFDAVPFTPAITANPKHNSVQLISPVDSTYGVRIRRTITLDNQKPVIMINTTYGKVRGEAVRVAIWSITQLDSPDRAFILLPQHSQFSQAFVNLTRGEPRDLKVDGRLLSLSRDLQSKTKIGSDGDALLWVGSGADLLIQSKAADLEGKISGDWPEQGSHSQIYTSPGNEMKYVEFELLDRLRELKVGEKASLQVVYTLIPRTASDPLAEARKVFHLP